MADAAATCAKLRAPPNACPGAQSPNPTFFSDLKKRNVKKAEWSGLDDLLKAKRNTQEPLKVLGMTCLQVHL